MCMECQLPVSQLLLLWFWINTFRRWCWRHLVCLLPRDVMAVTHALTAFFRISLLNLILLCDVIRRWGSVHPVYRSLLNPKVARYLSRYSDRLWAGRSGIESRWGRDFPPVQTGPGAYPASCKMGTGSFPGVKCGRDVLLTTHPLLLPRSWKSRAIPLPTLWATPGL